jgi:cell division septal protein FtsQ
MKLFRKGKKNAGPPERSDSRMIREAFLRERKPERRASSVRRDRRKRPGFRFGIVSFLWTAFFAVSGYAFLFSDFTPIRTVIVSGVDEIPSDRIESSVRGHLSGKRFGIFPGDAFFLLSTSRLGEKLLFDFPKLGTVSVTRHFPDAVRVDVTERDRIFLWCVGNSDDRCLLVGDDETARPADQALLSENGPFVVRVNDESGREIGIGDPVLSRQALDATLGIERMLRPGDMVRIGSTFFSPSRVSGEIRAVTEEGWDLLVNLDIDPAKTVASLRLVLEKEIPAEKRPTLRYVDLRSENRVFYAYREEQPEEADAERADNEESQFDSGNGGT